MSIVQLGREAVAWLPDLVRDHVSGATCVRVERGVAEDRSCVARLVGRVYHKEGGRCLVSCGGILVEVPAGRWDVDEEVSVLIS